jgi:hypothetical protein
VINVSQSSIDAVRFGFIIGTGRCGTTLLSKMLNAHTEACVPHELQILFEESGNGERLREVFERGDNVRYVAADYIHLIEERCPYRFQKYYDYEAFFRDRSYPEKSLRVLANDLFTDIARSKAKSYFIEQTPWHGQHLRSLNELFPHAKYIHLIRDGRDVAVSFSRTPWWSDDIMDNLRRWGREVTVILEDSSRFLSPEQIRLVRYEDLVRDPEHTLRGICVFLGLEFESAMLDSAHYIRYETFAKQSMAGISSDALRRWERDSKSATFVEQVSAWKNNTTVDFSRVDTAVERLLRQLGYEPSRDAPLVWHESLQLAYGTLLDRIRGSLRWLGK